MLDRKRRLSLKAKAKDSGAAPPPPASGLTNPAFQIAIENMRQGLAMFDGDQRLIFANETYRRMYGLKASTVRPGTPLSEIVKERIALGIFTVSGPEAYAQQRLARFDKANTAVEELSDGRFMLISRQPMQGGGWVTTHEDITELRRAEARIAHMSLHDGLTDLPNRTELHNRLDKLLSRLEQNELLALYVIDLDHFKDVNETFGQAFGDSTLKFVARRLLALSRGGDTVARCGGDEFAFIQSGFGRVDSAAALAQRLTEALQEPVTIDGLTSGISASVGIAIAPRDGGTPDLLLKKAGLALLAAKRAGGGRFNMFEKKMDEKTEGRRAVEAGLRGALARSEFVLYYQPLINVQRHSVSGFEALIRWRHPQRGLVSPADFIPVAEDIGLIEPIGEWVIATACTEAATWPQHLGLSVNLSPTQLRSAALPDFVASILRSTGLEPHRLEFEITETALLEDGELTMSMLRRLSALGVGFAMDDFGTGYSSLSYLQRFSFKKIKIDGSFVKRFTTDESSAKIVRSVIRLADSLGIVTTAEGVETFEQQEALSLEKCTELQGYYFSRPMPADQIAGYLM